MSALSSFSNLNCHANFNGSFFISCLPSRIVLRSRKYFVKWNPGFSIFHKSSHPCRLIQSAIALRDFSISISGTSRDFFKKAFVTTTIFFQNEYKNLCW